MLPSGFWLMLVAVAIAGSVAAMEAAPLLRWVTPAFGGLLILGARRDLSTPLVSPRSRATRLPPEVERRLLDTLAELPAGTARDLLADLTRTGEAVHSRLQLTGDSRESGSMVGELLLACCSAAADLALLDANLGRFERQRERLALRAAGSLDALARCERIRDGLVQRLLEAMTVLGKLQGQAADLATEGSALNETLAEIRAEAEARAKAEAEIEALLGGKAVGR